MNKNFKIIRATERGENKLGWLHARHTFSFGEYYNPNAMGFSDLRVINEDVVQPSTGFATHSHRDMEIFTYVLSGELSHQDSMGNGSTIKPGDVQLMSAGSGVTHSERNHSTTSPVHLLQIWILPEKQGISPSYQQRRFARTLSQAKLLPIIRPVKSEDALFINQDCTVYVAHLTAAETIEYVIPTNKVAYVHLARGELSLNSARLFAGDGVMITDPQNLQFSQAKDAEFLLFELNQ